jgi:hypothetical protein
MQLPNGVPGRKTPAAKPVGSFCVQIQLLAVQLISYFFLAGAFFFAGFAAGLAVDRPGLWALQVLHMFVTSLPLLYLNHSNWFYLWQQG